MRKINSILSIVVFSIFVLHMIAGGLLMANAIPYIPALHHSLSGLLAAAALLHTVIAVKLTADTLVAVKKSGVSYMKENTIFWARRASGFAVMAFIIVHSLIFIFEKGEPGSFTPAELACSIMLSVSVLVHVVTNIRPLMTALGRSGRGKAAVTAIFVVSLPVLISAAAFVVYFIVSGVR